MTGRSERRLRRWLGLGLIAGSLAVALPAAAEEPQGWGYDLAGEIMSPFCPGRTLSECPSGQAEELRVWILDEERAGASRSEVEAELFRIWGDDLLQAPRAEGVGLLAYLIPFVCFAAGGALVYLFLRRQRAGEKPRREGVPRAASDPELERLLDAELNELSPGHPGEPSAGASR